jgi:hypothetical protein
MIGAPPERHRRLWLDNARFAVADWSGERVRLVGFNLERLDDHGS